MKIFTNKHLNTEFQVKRGPVHDKSPSPDITLTPKLQSSIRDPCSREGKVLLAVAGVLIQPVASTSQARVRP